MRGWWIPLSSQIKDKQKAQALIKFLKALDFIEEVSSKETFSQPKGKVKEKDFFSIHR